MPRIEHSLAIDAPIERVFDLARSIDAHALGQAARGERVVAGRESGLIEMGESVTWEARHLGVRQRLESRITAMDRPHHFRDVMVRGAFARFDHDHHFERRDGLTWMRDVFDYTAPLGPLGRLADALFLEAYMTRFVEERAAHLKALAEGEDWRALLPKGD